MLEDLSLISSSCFSFSYVSSLSKDALWHARLGHPHVRALSIMLPGVMFKIMIVRHVFWANIVGLCFKDHPLFMRIALI